MTLLEEKVYKIVQEIPRGKVTTYGRIAEKLGNKKLCRVIGNILHKNPIPYDKDKLLKDGLVQIDKIPCHRVVNAKGCMGSNFGLGGSLEQAKMLIAENVQVIDCKVDLNKYLAW